MLRHPERAKRDIAVLEAVLDRNIVVIHHGGTPPRLPETTRNGGQPIFVYFDARREHYDGLTLQPNAHAGRIIQDLSQQQAAARSPTPSAYPPPQNALTITATVAAPASPQATDVATGVAPPPVARPGGHGGNATS